MRSTKELQIYHALISQVIIENPDDPRIETPKESLRIIEEELERRSNMPDFDRMEIDELKAFRDKIAKEREGLKHDFVAAGKVLDRKLQDADLVEEYKRLEEKRKALEERIGAIPEPQRVNLRTLLFKAKQEKVGE
jgi:hypothetical protein